MTKDTEYVEKPDSRLDLLYEVGKTASSTPELSTLIDQIVSMTQHALKAAASSVLLLDEEKQELLFELAEGDVGKTLKESRISVESGIAGWVARHGKPLIVNDVTRDRRFCEDVDKATGFVTRSIMCAPLVTQGRTVGVIEVLNKLDGSDFNGQDLEALEAVASTAAMAIECKRTEEALRVSEEHYCALVGSLTDGVFEFREGIVTWCNDRVEEIYGYNKEELIGQPVRFPYPLDSAPLEQNRIVSAAIKKEGHFCDMARIKKKDGTAIDIEYTISQVQGKEPVEFVAVIRDITERKRAEEERHRMEQQLQLAGRLAAVGELAAGVAHELNNPLAAVQGFAQLLTQKKNLNEDVKLDLETIYTEAQRASKITSNLLSFARKRNPEKRLISINEALAQSLDLHTYRLRVNNIEVLVELDPDLPKTMADFHQMQQVFVNIITNAEQAMTEAHGRGQLLAKTESVDDIIRVTLADNGPGISEENQKRIFDPFYTTKEVGKGTGLGLSICYGIIQEHNGSVYVKSKPDNGATFIVEMPVISEDQFNAGEENHTRMHGH